MMLTDPQLQLLTAAIDGKLSPAEARRLRRLLDASPEARDTLARLKADAERLRTLPRIAPPADLAARVMTRIAAVTPAPQAEPSAILFATTARRLPVWVPAAVAASLLVGIASASFFLFRDTGGAGSTARTPPLETVVPPNDWSRSLPDPDSLPSAPPPRPHVGSGSVVKGELPVPPGVEPRPWQLAPEPRAVQPDLVAFPPITAPSFDQVKVRVPFLRSVGDFARAESRQELADELARDPAYRIDVFTRDPARAVEVFQTAAKAAGVTVHADAATLDRVKKRQVNAVIVYTEALTEAEVAAVFGRLAAADAKISPRVFDSLHAIPVTRTDERSLVETLGRDPGLYKRADLGAGAKADPSKPLSDGTAQHIVDRVGGAGAASPGAEKPAVLLAWAPPALRTAPSASAELKQFFAKRGDRKPGVVPVVIVIRPGNG